MIPDKILEELKQQQDDNHGLLTSLIGITNGIKDVLTGNKHNPYDKGILGEIERLKAEQANMKTYVDMKVAPIDARVSVVEKFKDRAIWVAVGIGGGGGWGVTWLIGKIFTKH